MRQKPAFDSSIPVLTEVVLEPVPVDAGPVPTLRDTVEPRLEPIAPAAPVAETPAVSTPPAQPDWDELERRIVERVVAQLQPQLDAVVRSALASAGDQIHIGLRQAVEQAVAQQVAAIQFGKT